MRLSPAQVACLGRVAEFPTFAGSSRDRATLVALEARGLVRRAGSHVIDSGNSSFRRSAYSITEEGRVTLDQIFPGDSSRPLP